MPLSVSVHLLLKDFNCRANKWQQANTVPLKQAGCGAMNQMYFFMFWVDREIRQQFYTLFYIPHPNPVIISLKMPMMKKIWIFSTGQNYIEKNISQIWWNKTMKTMTEYHYTRNKNENVRAGRMEKRAIRTTSWSSCKGIQSYCQLGWCILKQNYRKQPRDMQEQELHKCCTVTLEKNKAEFHTVCIFLTFRCFTLYLISCAVLVALKYLISVSFTF